MEKTRKTDWLRTQGYRLSSLPFKVTWYSIDKNNGKEREFTSRTDDYNLDLYRRKGYVLNRKYLDPQAWHELEYGVKLPVETVQTVTTVTADRATGEPPKDPGIIPRLAKAIRVGCEREGFLARNSIGTVSPYRPW